MYKYVAFGIAIHSEIELPELGSEMEGDPGITIRRGILPRICAKGDGSAFRFEDSRATFEWAAVGRFLIIDKTTILVDTNQGVSDAVTRMPLLGPVLALALHVNGHLILHASAVALPGGGVVFMGDKGAGKSSTAAMLMSRGNSLLADDIVLIKPGDDRLIMPGFPQMKLTDESSEVADLRDSDLQPEIGVEGLDKRRHLITKGFAEHPAVPLRLYVLKRGETMAVRRCGSAEALEAILRFSYVARFGHRALRHSRAGDFLSQCSMLAASGLVHELSVPRSLDELRDAIEFIEHDALV